MRQVFLSFILLLGLLLSYSSVNAKVWTVTNTNDSGLGSLRAAKDSCASGDTIRFDVSLLSSGNDTILLTSGEIDFGNKAITIIGLYNSTDTLFISGGGSSRIFSFNGAGKVILDSLALINGNGVGSLLSGYGGAVFYYNSTDTLFIKNCVIRNNSTSGGGGGIYSAYSSYFSSSSSSVSIINSTISGNSAGSYGGGVAAYSASSSTISSSVSIINSTINGNSAGSYGGGVAAYSTTSSTISSSYVTIINSTINGNSANSDGGGVYSEASSSSISIDNSTITGNAASVYGGGVCASANDSSIVSIINSTISENSAYYGGGVYASSGGISAINTTSSIVALNTVVGSNKNFYNSQTPTITSGGYNIFGDSPSGATGTDQVNITSAQLNLQPLAYNGGLTKTMLPGPGSVAINMGNPSDMSDAQNGPVSCGRRDVGAAEVTLETFASIAPTTCGSYTSPSGNYTWTQSGIYKDTLTNAAGCDSIIIINLTVTKVDTSVTFNPPVITSNATGATYQWLDCNNNLSPIQGATGQSFTATSSGNYAVEVTYNGCKDTSSCHYVVVSGLYANDFGAKLSVYPNPNQGAFKIDLGNKYEQAEITIIDLAGKLVYKNTFYNTQIADINIKDISSGIYYVRINSGNKKAMLKIIVQ